MDSNPVGWFEIYVQDMERARRFYEAVFATTLKRLETSQPEMWVFDMHRDGYGCTGSLVRMQGVPSGGNSIVVYFHSADCAVEESRVTAAGGSVLRSKWSIGQHGFIALVKDTEGNTIGLHSMT